MLNKQQSGNTTCKDVNISTDLEIIKGLYRNYEDGYTRNSMKPTLKVLNEGQEQEEQKNQREND
jgi:hypothetical protein